MDQSFAMVSDEGSLPWISKRSDTLEEGRRDIVTPPSPGLGGITVTWNTPYATTAHMQTGQLSPISTGMDTSLDPSCAPSMIHSTAASSCPDSWSPGADCDDGNEWEQTHGDAMVPKLEPMEDDFDFTDLATAATTPSLASRSLAKQKRPRGRPRKHPLAPLISSSKITKGRSKTGCITCRKRKKKCDEAKPRCMNCEKNAVVCEGYHERQLWRSGREKAEQDRTRTDSLPNITMQPIFHGVETQEDKIFWRHYINHFSNVLTVESEAKNAFKDIILHLANQHQGLMHSILCVSSKHIDFDAPYGQKLLQDNPDTSRLALQERSDYHHDEAMKRFHDDMNTSVNQQDAEYHTEEYQTLLCARYSQILCFLLQTRADGNPRGEHRLHLQAYKTLIQHSPPEDATFAGFISEFFQYHIFADDLMWHPDSQLQRLSSDEWDAPDNIFQPRLLGVADGLFRHMSSIITLRHAIREQAASGIDPPVDYVMLFRAAEIEGSIRDWKPRWPSGDSRNRVGLLYQQMMWVYLYRTIYPPSAIPSRRSTLATLPVMMMPSPSSSTSTTPQRRASMAGGVLSTAIPPVRAQAQSCPSSRNPSRTSSMHERDTYAIIEEGEAASLPTKRRPGQEDRRLHVTVEEALRILESFGPSDPGQALLLVPCLVIGIACFEPEQQGRVRKAIKAVRGYTGLRNGDRITELLEEIWSLMEAGDWWTVWDYQTVARRQGIDSLCT